MEWRHVTFIDLARRIQAGVWRWKKCGRRLQLEARDGTLYDFKLQGRPEIREVEKEARSL